MKADPIGLYVHIPFCVKKCNYCDFCSFAIDDRKDYIDALCREIDGYKGKNISVDTIFFGGGTPSLLSADEFFQISRHIKDSFEVLDNAEFTLEANPKTLNKENLSAYIKSGVNRISMGLQSIHENELKILGRIHNFNDFLDTYKMVINSGIDNINIDLMYGIPDQTLDSFKQTLMSVLSLRPSHISLYGLILEKGTKFYESKESLNFPSEDEECDMYFFAQKIMQKFGFNHYEISNYSKQGMESHHNLKYWRDEEYIGLGLSAYSYFEGKRFGNTTSFADYLAGKNRIAFKEFIDKENEAYEYVMLHTRLKEGFSFSDYINRFGVDFVSGREELISKFEKSGHIIISNGRLSFTDKGMYVSNSLLTELI